MLFLRSVLISVGVYTKCFFPKCSVHHCASYQNFERPIGIQFSFLVMEIFWSNTVIWYNTLQYITIHYRKINKQSQNHRGLTSLKYIYNPIRSSPFLLMFGRKSKYFSLSKGYLRWETRVFITFDDYRHIQTIMQETWNRGSQSIGHVVTEDLLVQLLEAKHMQPEQILSYVSKLIIFL